MNHIKKIAEDIFGWLIVLALLTLWLSDSRIIINGKKYGLVYKVNSNQQAVIYPDLVASTLSFANTKQMYTEDALSQINTIWEAANELIPPANSIKIGNIELGVFGLLRGWGRLIGDMPFLRVQEDSYGPWKELKDPLYLFSLEEAVQKVGFSEQECGEVRKLMPSVFDTVEKRNERFIELKNKILQKYGATLMRG